MVKNMKKSIIAATITLLVIVMINCCGNAVMAIFFSDSYVQMEYWESAVALLIVGAVAIVLLVGIAAYRWLPTLWYCVRAERTKCLAEEMYFERKARIEWNRRS